MSKVIKLKKGIDIKLNGEAEKVVQTAGKITSCALKPTDFRAMTPKLAVKAVSYTHLLPDRSQSGGDASVTDHYQRCAI